MIVRHRRTEDIKGTLRESVHQRSVSGGHCMRREYKAPLPLSKDDGIQHPNVSPFPFLTASRRCDALARAHIYLVALYLAIGVSVVALDLGAKDFGKMFTEYGQSVIPSIRPTSQITSMPESSALVLSISWVWGVVFSLPLLWLLAIDGRAALNLAFLKKTLNPLKIAFIWTLIPTGTFLLATQSPDTLAEANGFLLRCIRASPYSIVLWGIGIFSLLSVAVDTVCISVVCVLTTNIGR